MYDVYKHVDALGNCWQAEVVAGQFVKRTDRQGIGRLIETRDPLGRSERISYLRHWAFL